MTSRIFPSAAALLFCLLTVAETTAQDDKAPTASNQSKQAKAIFEKLKSLVGEWEHQGNGLQLRDPTR